MELARRYRERNVIPARALSGLISALLVLPLASPFSVAASDVAALAAMGLVVLPLSFGLIFIGQAARAIATWLATARSELRWQERLACILSYVPKATIQAAFGAVAVDAGLQGGNSH